MSDDRKPVTAASVAQAVRDFVDRSPENHLGDEACEKAFDTPLVGFAAGDDPLFAAYKDHVGPFHWTPLEIFTRTFPESVIRSENLTVISWILPQTGATKAANRRETRFPAEHWSRARTFGETFNRKVREEVVAMLAGAGIRAVAPMLSTDWERRDSPRYGFASTWSERHAAYACGLGTFGLSDGLITPLGKAVRVGSVVGAVRIEPTPRPYGHHQAYCLFLTRGLCGQCMKRCPAGAITAAGHDKITCKAYIRQTTMPYIKTRYGFDGKGCGLCQTGVPCESRIPVAD